MEITENADLIGNLEISSVHTNGNHLLKVSSPKSIPRSKSNSAANVRKQLENLKSNILK